MQRSKQQALMFLLGAVLVGGVLGFSADRIMTKKPQRVPARVRMYDDIGITREQRVKMDSLLDETNCKTGDVLRSARPAIDSIRAEMLKSLVAMMTPEQRVAYQEREQRFKAMADSMEKAREAQRAKDGTERRRCAGSGSTGSGSRPGIGLKAPPKPEAARPGGPFF